MAARLIYTGITSLDGYINDASGSFEWAFPDEELHAFVNETERSIGTHIYGRRLYETMVYWETAGLDANGAPGDASEDTAADAVEREYGEIWRGLDKVVFSRTLTQPSSARTTLHAEFDPSIVEKLKQTSTADVSVGGADLGGQALRAGLVDLVEIYAHPVIVGGGARFLPDLGSGDSRIDLELVDHRTFASGVTLHRYVPRT